MSVYIDEFTRPSDVLEYMASYMKESGLIQITIYAIIEGPTMRLVIPGREYRIIHDQRLIDLAEANTEIEQFLASDSYKELSTGGDE